MRLYQILTILLLSAGTFTAYSQTNLAESAHARAHKQQLANAKSRLDKTVIKDFIKNDVERREQVAESSKGISRESAIMVADLLKEAHSHIGKRYRSGGKGPSAFDCSGFSSYIYHQFGFSLSASSSAQYTDGVSVEKDDLRPGDLVFFKGRNSRGGIGHVGIVVNADNEKGTFSFIHASTSQGIRIDVNEGYYATRYVGARRIIAD